MKVPPSTHGIGGGGAIKSADAGRAKGTSGKAEATPAGAAVQLSSLSTQLHVLASSLSGPEFDRAKVDQIKHAIRDGKLMVRTDVVADRMIEDVKDRLARGAK
jgi:flagellar biosynthesis anti-sigma factor FlgM